MKKPTLYLALMVVMGLGGPFGWQAAQALAARDARNTYRTLEPDVYYPSFYKRLEQDRTRGAAWVRVPAEVALNFIGRTRVCPNQQVGSMPAAEGRRVFIVTHVCPYSRMVVKEFRIDLIERDGAWAIEWAGMRLKCAVNQSQIGEFLISHNPFVARLSLLMPLNEAVRSFANSLNPWMHECP